MEITALGVSVLGGRHCPSQPKNVFLSAGIDDGNGHPPRWLYHVKFDEFHLSGRNFASVLVWICECSVLDSKNKCES